MGAAGTWQTDTDPILRTARRPVSYTHLDVYKRQYHSPLCQASAEKARKYFLRMQMHSPSNPVYSCYDGHRSADPIIIRDKLSRQVQHPIHWKTLADNCGSDGIRSLIEIGPGCTVSGNTRIANPNIACQWVQTMNEVRCCDAV